MFGGRLIDLEVLARDQMRNTCVRALLYGKNSFLGLWFAAMAEGNQPTMDLEYFQFDF